MAENAALFERNGLELLQKIHDQLATISDQLMAAKGEQAEGDLVDTDAASKILRIKADTLSVWRCRGDGPKYFKIGRTVRYSRRDLEEFMRQAQVNR